MGTPEFAVEPLRQIIDAGYHVIAVITAPDKPAGRGQKIHFSPVKDFALSHSLIVLQPVNLKNPEFIKELESYKANLQVVVAFRMLPTIIWEMPEYGTLNLHASLLPQYRGAAPINHAILNGETETGLTTFYIEKEIDTGNIILSRKLPILPSDDAGKLHDRLSVEGGLLMLETLKLIETGNDKPMAQDGNISSSLVLHPAPKIFKEDCRINWNNPSKKIHDFIRGLSPFPSAFSTLVSADSVKQVKIFQTSYELKATKMVPGMILSDNKIALSVFTQDGIIHIEELQVEGKRRMSTADFLRGMPLIGLFHFE